MAVCLNTESAYKIFSILTNDKFFVDKSGIIEKINARINTSNRFLCVTKPRRFGKTCILNMLGAYYGSVCSSKELFDLLQVSSCSTYLEHLNKYNIITLCLNDLPDDGNTYEDYIKLIKDSIIDDIKDAYPELNSKKFKKISDLLTATQEQFIFLIDEWDYIFSHELFAEHHSEFLEFLRNLLKDRPYVALAYMTGVLPIKKYSTGSALNMFREYTMLKDPFFERYFGFTEDEVMELCGRQSVLTMEEMSEWYDGYQSGNGDRLYNPRSVVCALEDEACQSYWTRTGKMDEVLFFLKYNIGDVRDDVVRMVDGFPIMIDIKKEYSAGQGEPTNRSDIYAAMIIYGLLSYCDGQLRIPNKELMLEFEEALKDDEFGYVAELAQKGVYMKDRGEQARDYFKQGYNCTQSVALAFCDEIGIEKSRMLKMVSSFGGGMGRLREVCGAVSGMFFVAGALYGYDDPKDMQAKKEHYARIQELAAQFREKNGSIVCRELLGLEGRDSSPVPSERTEEYYKKRPCAEMIATAAGLMEDYIKRHPLV